MERHGKYNARPVVDPVTITLDFRIKPYVRMTQRGKFVKAAAQEYIANQQLIRYAIGHPPMMPGQTPLCVTIQQRIAGAVHNHDGDNVIKALLDAMKGIVYPDDRWADAITYERTQASEDLTVITVAVLAETMEVTK